MVKHKWYVVVVGRDVGVFTSWLDAGPLVKGVPNAVHQSFTTREEALRRFQEAQARGAIQIVDPDAPPNGPRRPSGNSPRPFTSSAPSRTPVHALVPTRMNSSHTSPDRIRHTTSPQTLPSSPLSWSSSEPSPKLSRLQEIQTAFDRLAVGAESRASSVMSSTRSSPATRSARTSTPTAEVSGRGLQRASTASPEIFRGSRCPADNVSSRTPHVIVRTPSWIRSHPKTSTPGPSEGTLSPLSSVNLKLHSFPVGDRHDYDISHSPRAPRRSPSNKTPSPSCSSNNALNQATTSGDVRAGQRIIRTRQIMHDTDPRSPILDQSQVPELVYENIFSFTRPSPQVQHEPLPTPPSSSRVGSSLLFQHETPLSPMRGQNQI